MEKKIKSIIIYTVHKAASMFLHRATEQVACEYRICYYSKNNHHYNEIKKSSWKKIIEEKPQPSCFGPVRADELQDLFPQFLSEYSVVLHLRDPRDVLTSLFFSHVYSHNREEGRFNPSNELREKWKKDGIDFFVLGKLETFKKRYLLLISTLLHRKNVIFVKYEDLIFNYSAWLDRFISAFSHLEIPIEKKYGFIFPNSEKKIRNRIFKKYKNEFIPPKQENIYDHKRQIKPGDHRNKLQRQTIETLNREFSDILEILSYPI